MRTIEQIQKNIKRQIKSGLNLKEPNKVQKTVHFEDKKKIPTETQINEAINLEKKLRKTYYKVEVEKKLNNELEKQKAFEPFTTGLKIIEQAVRKTDDDIRSFLVPVTWDAPEASVVREVRGRSHQQMTGLLAHVHRHSDRGTALRNHTPVRSVLPAVQNAIYKYIYNAIIKNGLT